MRSVVPCWSTISVETREAVQRRGGIEDFLDVGAERGPVDDGRDARGQDCAGDRAAEVVDRDAAEDRDALRRQVGRDRGGAGGGIGCSDQDAIAGLENHRQGCRLGEHFSAEVM
jgi:hypothetical protein